MVYNIPFCHLPNSKVQTIDLANTQLTTFQVDWLGAVSCRPDFAYFVVCGCTPEEGNGKTEVIVFDDIKGPFNIMWYDKSGKCQWARVGVARVLKRREYEGSAPAPLDHIIYTTRCN